MRAKLINSLILIVLGYFVGVIANFVIDVDKAMLDILANFTGTFAMSGFGIGFIGAALYFLNAKDKDKNSEIRHGKTFAGDTIEQYFDSRWVTEEELRTVKGFMPNTWENLYKVKRSGWVFRNSMVKNKLLINMYDSDVHCLVIGTSGSGKTTAVIDPTIRVLAETGEKPTLVITDPKGELFNRHAEVLKQKGYNVEALDLRNPFSSSRWNPMENPFSMYRRAQNLAQEVKLYEGDPATSKLKIIKDVPYEKTWYAFNGVAYPNREKLDSDLEAFKKILITDAENELREIAEVIVPIESNQDSSWERGARDFLYGLMLAMLEDSDKPELGMTKEKFNFYNLGKIATFKDNDPDNPFGTLREYCSGRGELSKVMSLTSTVINNAPGTSKSYMGVLQGKIGFMQDSGICYATSLNEIDFKKMIDRPTAFFIKVPDDKESRHCIATLCISQLYKDLIGVASNCPNLVLPRTVYCLLDEFANLPKVPKMDSLITVARSRRIFFELVIQSYEQLDAKYGKEAASTIRGNCNMQIYIGTDDMKTKEDFSKQCGEISIEKKEISESKNEKSDSGSSKTINDRLVTRPLIFPNELGLLPPGTVIVKIFRQNPIKVALTPFYKIPYFITKPSIEEYHPTKTINEKEVFYSIVKRNETVLSDRGYRGVRF